MSADGRLIAFNDGLPGGSLHLVPADGGTLRVIVDASRPGMPSAGLPVWSEDGRTIYFKSHDADGNASIWAVPRNGGTPRLVVQFTDPTRPSYRPSLALLSHGTFYFTVEDRQSDVWVVELVTR